MELTQVHYFLTLCRTLNFTRATEQCNVTQPAFTRSIQKLEGEFGGPLLFRERNSTQLTELGRSMRPHLEAMLDAADAARALAQTKLTRVSLSLKIGLGPGVGAADIAGAVRDAALFLSFGSKTGHDISLPPIFGMKLCFVANCSTPRNGGRSQGKIIVLETDPA